MNPEKIAELEAKVSQAKEAADAASGTDETSNKVLADAEAALAAAKKAPSQKTERTPAEIAAHNLKQKAEDAVKAGLDPSEVLGIKSKPFQIGDDLPDDAPLTVGTFREIQKKDARKTAEEMADALPDTDERDRVKAELAFIVPSGDAQADFRRAQAAANAERNAKIITESLRRGPKKNNAAGGSADLQAEGEFTPTPDEAVMMKPPYSLSKEKILAARQKTAQKAG